VQQRGAHYTDRECAVNNFSKKSSESFTAA